MRNLFKEKNLDIFIDLLLLVALFEKIQYSYFKLFDIVSMVFVAMVLVLGMANKLVIRDGNIRILFLSKIAMFILYFIQGIIVMVDGRPEIFDQYSKGILVNGIMNTFVVLSAILYLSVYSKICIEGLLKRFAIIGAINVIYNIIQYFNRNIDDLLFKNLLHSSVSRYGTDAYGAGVGRLTGLFTDSNNNAAFLIIYFMVIFTITKGLRGWKKILLYAVLVLTGVELVLTYSRTGWLGIAICVLFILFKEGLLKNKRLLFLIIIGVFLGIYMYNNNYVFNQVMTARLQGMDSNNSHLEAARNVLIIVAQSPVYLLLGVGTNCLSVHYEALFGRIGMKAHSLYLQVLCEDGIIGLICTLVFWGTILLMTHKATKSEFRFYGLPIAIWGFLIINITYDSAFQPLYFWMLTVAIVAYREKCLDNNAVMNNDNSIDSVIYGKNSLGK